MEPTHKLRTTVIFLSLIGAYLVILLYLAGLQLGKRTFFERLAKAQYHVVLKQLPPRGMIYDRHGEPLTHNVDSYAAFLVPRQLKERAKTEQILAHHFPESYKRLLKKPKAHFMYIKRRLTPDELMLIKKLDSPDIHILKEPHRIYTVPSASQVVGITNIDNEGILGLEQVYNKLLRGAPTTYALQRDARSGHFYFAKETTIEGEDAQPLHTTLDSHVQVLVQRELEQTIEHVGATECMAVIMDPVSGDIISMNQYPTFNANNTREIPVELQKNKIISDTHEFGSVMKILTALSALEHNDVTLDEMIDCENKKTTFINGMQVNTPVPTIAGVIPFEDVIARSNNIGTVKVASRVGTKLYDTYRKLGFGQHSGLKFPGEQPGYVSHPSQWSKRSIISLSFGYESRVTLLQLARAFAMFSNGGRLVQPRLDRSQPITPLSELPQLFDQQTLDSCREILRRTVTKHGAKKADIEGYTIMGKTGTANILENGHYNHNKNIYTFCGILEKGDYKRVIVVFVNQSKFHNVYSSGITVPLFDRIVRRLIIHDQLIFKEDV